MFFVFQDIEHLRREDRHRYIDCVRKRWRIQYKNHEINVSYTFLLKMHLIGFHDMERALSLLDADTKNHLVRFLKLPWGLKCDTVFCDPVPVSAQVKSFMGMLLYRDLERAPTALCTKSICQAG